MNAPTSQERRLYFAVAEMPQTCRCGVVPDTGKLVLRSVESVEKCKACAKGWWPR